MFPSVLRMHVTDQCDVANLGDAIQRFRERYVALILRPRGKAQTAPLLGPYVRDIFQPFLGTGVFNSDGKFASSTPIYPG